MIEWNRWIYSRRWSVDQFHIFNKVKCGSFFCKTTATMQATNIEGWMDGDAQGDAILKIRCKAMLSAILTSTRDGDFSKWTFTMWTRWWSNTFWNYEYYNPDFCREMFSIWLAHISQMGWSHQLLSTSEVYRVFLANLPKIGVPHQRFWSQKKVIWGQQTKTANCNKTCSIDVFVGLDRLGGKCIYIYISSCS